MRKLVFVLYLSLLGLAVPETFSQQVLPLDKAVAELLSANFEINISKKLAVVDSLNVTAGNAGMLPQIAAVVTNNNTVLNQTQSQANGNEIEIDGAKNLNINYGVALDWTVFDGFRMFSRKKELAEIRNQGTAEFKAAVLDRLAALYNAYFTVSVLQTQVATLDEVIRVSEERLRIVQARFQIGKAARLEVLNAEVDLNADRSQRLELQQVLSDTKVSLSGILGRRDFVDFTVENLPQQLLTLDKEALRAKMIAENPTLQLGQINKRIAEQQLRQAKSSRYPTLSVNTGYNLIRNQTPFGFVTESTGRNFTYGFTARLNLFDGFNQNRLERVAKTQVEIARLAEDQVLVQLQAQFDQLFSRYLFAIERLGVERENETLAARNLEITDDKFKIGTVSAIEYRTAQNNFSQAKLRLADAALDVELLVVAIEQLCGTLKV
ncbi:TolC family protein [Flavobacterium sp.]|uniref:TolC family protein n=1 Tax=Flavobacterium sp. TaxID=239 RepID=UPI00262DFAA1|nr:TolC family protein [Flavobacterium sp.]